MTVFAKKKESSGKNKESSSKNSAGNSGNNGPNCTIPNINSEVESNVSGRDQAEPHPHLPNFDSQPEDMALRSGMSDVLRGSGPLSASLWSHSQGHSLGCASNSDIRGQPHYDYHMESAAPHHGKRRHRLSPLRTARSKHSRVERDRSNNSSPNTVASVVSGYNGPAPTAVEPSTSLPLCSLPMSPSSTACNSEDEHESRPASELTEEEWVEREKRFEKKIRKKGLSIKKMGEDGACLFRAVADQVYGDQDMHDIVRKHCMDYIAANGDYYSPYVTEDFKHYVNRKRHDNCHGNHIEIQAMCEMYNRTIEVFCYSTEPINAFHGVHQTDNAPIRLSYHRGVHYNSVVDPYSATIGVGLGLPGNHPGLADKNMLSEATRQSEDIHIEQAMLEDKVRATDWEATNEAIEEQVARESYLQWLKDNERRNRAARPAMASSSSATVTSSSTSDIRSPRSRTHGNLSPLGSPYRSEVRNSPSRHSPPPSIPGPSSKIGSPNPHSPTALHSNGLTSSIPETPPLAFKFVDPANYELPASVFDLNAWDDAGILAQVLAASQQEYFDNIKRSRESVGLTSNNGPISPPHSAHSSAFIINAAGHRGEGQD